MIWTGIIIGVIIGMIAIAVLPKKPRSKTKYDWSWRAFWNDSGDDVVHFPE